MIEIRLFGSLRRFAENPSVTAKSIAWATAEPGDTVADVLRRLGIDPEQEVGQVFVNGRYFYRAREMSVRDGDRLGIFPRNMAMLYV
jgi:molybdopterin converting factor small subunit